MPALRPGYSKVDNLFDLFMAPSSQELEPPQNPGRFTSELNSPYEPARMLVTVTSFVTVKILLQTPILP